MINQNKQDIELESMACYTNKINYTLKLTSNDFTKKITKNPANLWTILLLRDLENLIKIFDN